MACDMAALMDIHWASGVLDTSAHGAQEDGAWYRARKQQEIQFWDIGDLLHSEKDWISSHTGGVSPIRAAIACRLLILDECQDRGGTPWEEQAFRSIINRRYAEMLRTILMGSFDDCEAFLGEAITRRVLDSGDIVKADWGLVK